MGKALQFVCLFGVVVSAYVDSLPVVTPSVMIRLHCRYALYVEIQAEEAARNGLTFKALCDISSSVSCSKVRTGV